MNLVILARFRAVSAQVVASLKPLIELYRSLLPFLVTNSLRKATPMVEPRSNRPPREFMRTANCLAKLVVWHAVNTWVLSVESSARL